MIYMDNGATSWPKPPEMLDAMTEAISSYCANPGRAGHAAAARTAREIYRTRTAAASLFNIEDPAQIIFTRNCTEAINLALKGILGKGDHVITSSMEHNSVLRPLKQLESAGISTTVIRCDRQGRISVRDIRAAVRTNTRMIVITAASNVTGTRMPLEEIGRIALRNGILFMVDGAQGAGHMDLDVRRNHIDLLAVPGHKGLMGPQGTGFLYVKKGIELTPLVEGGTGTKSKELEQPRDFPEGFEAGTLNAPGIIGLGASIRMIDRIGVSAIQAHEEKLVRRLQRGLEGIRGVTVYGPEDPGDKAAIVAVNIDGIDCETAAAILDERFGIAVRAGFHCSGLAHDTIGTGDIGCIRLCPGLYTAERDIGMVTDAIAQLAALSGMRNK
ncbi:MAG: aminotransferase class V-fold PLP-dependent enzyme [Firmicutes bacterium]|nr:aminotransferase class V-fold PLP-dependent enzyme [Bacillota bacterium]